MKKVFLALFLPLLAFTVVFFNSGIAKADPFARQARTGYFYGAYEERGSDLFDEGIYSTNVQSFIDTYYLKLFSPNPKDHVSSAFTILTMLGAPAGTPWTQAKDRFNEWQGVVRWYDAQGRISWASMYPYYFNTYYLNGSNDVGWFVSPDTRDSIVFTNPDNSSYAIKKDCANPVGDMRALFIPPPPPPPPPPPTVVTCGSMNVIPASSPEVGQTISVRVSATFSGGPPAPTTGAIIRVIGPGGFDREFLGVRPSSSVPPGPTGGTVSYTSPDFVVPNPGLYSVGWIVGVNESNTGICGGTLNPNYDAFEVRNYPFMSSRGSDVAAGSRFVTTPGGSCGPSNMNAGIASWNRGTAPYAGAGSQYGASAMSFIQGFITNKGNTWSPTSLSFSNQDYPGQNSVDEGAGRYGGFYRQGPCVEYWKEKPSTVSAVPNPTNASLNGLSGVYVHPAGQNLTINPSNIGAGTRLTIYVEGNVNIRGNITYGGADPSWANLGEIPVLKLIVKGTIHIDSSVDRLDGIYVAIPANANYFNQVNSYAAPAAGTISTCSNGFSVRSPAVAPVGTMVNACNRRLTVNGSLVANQIFFLRTAGTMSNNSSAEQFDFSPEVWLAPNEGGGVDPTYQSIIGLPPVL